MAELEGELFDTKQRADDLKAYLQSIEARNRVLVGLVEGLTARPGEGEDGEGGEFQGAHRALEQLDRDLELLATTLRKSRDELKLAHRERDRIKNNFNDAMRTLEDSKAREAQATARVDTFRVMLVKLKAMIDENQLDVQVVRNRMVVKLPEALLFDSGSAALKPDGQRALQQLAGVLRGIEDREFQVAGHTDDVERRGKYRSAWELSSARAVNVTRFLVEQGVPPQRLSAAGYGSTRPLDPSPTREARARNRRIEIVLMPNLGELPDLSTLEDALTAPEEPATPVMRLRASPSPDQQPPPVMKIERKGPPAPPAP